MDFEETLREKSIFWARDSKPGLTKNESACPARAGNMHILKHMSIGHIVGVLLKLLCELPEKKNSIDVDATEVCDVYAKRVKYTKAYIFVEFGNLFIFFLASVF